MFVPKLKFVSLVDVEMWTFIFRNLDYVTIHLIFMKFKHKSAKGISNEYQLAVTLTFDPKSPISIESEPV